MNYLLRMGTSKARFNNTDQFHFFSLVAKRFQCPLKNGCGIEELGELQHLRGKLCGRNLQNVTDASDALEVVLKGNEHLKKLELSWNDSLQEQRLEIECFPLELFPKLGFLSISKFPSLVSFNKEGSPKLTELYFSFCLNLKSLPERMHSLVNFKILGSCPEVESFPIEVFSSNKLQTLYVIGCKKLIASRMQWDLQNLPSLSYFTFGRYNDLESFPEETLLPSTLKSLTIRSLPQLKSLDFKVLRLPTSLRELTIYGCPQLQSMPEEGLPSSLSSLVIGRCPLLEKKVYKGYRGAKIGTRFLNFPK
ncbi:disease resistance protein [Populus alba x Populus x berolinensis]|uniref:Disease resistance protein n=1 Tax=Populus alba x Populus x berolinensis TaxID=444605 RepID=A0AAD6RAC4_9ROSI|nr:disease resistance protein [Populus alba x Populus x berolinensis]